MVLHKLSTNVVNVLPAGLRLGASALQLLVGILVGHLFGTSLLAEFALVQGSALLFGSIIALGVPVFVLRKTSTASTDKAPDIAQWLALAYRICLMMSLPVAIAIFVLSTTFAPRPLSTLEAVAILLSPLLWAFIRVFAEFLKGINKATTSIALEFIVPSTLVAAIIIMQSMSGFMALSIPVLYLLSYVPSVAYSVFYWAKTYRRETKREPKKLSRNDLWQILSLGVIQILGMAIWYVPLLLLGAASGVNDLASFYTIQRFCTVALTVSAAIGSASSFRAISVIRSNDPRACLRLYAKLMLFNGLLSAIVLFLPIFAPEWAFGIFSVEASSMAKYAAISLGTLLLAKQFLGFSEMFLAYSGKSSVDFVSSAVGYAILGIILLVFQVNLLTACIAIGTAILVRSIFSTTLLVLDMSRDKQLVGQ